MIEKNVHETTYKTVTEFVDDINLVFTNCYDFNGPLNGKFLFLSVIFSRQVSADLFGF